MLLFGGYANKEMLIINEKHNVPEVLASSGFDMFIFNSIDWWRNTEVFSVNDKMVSPESFSLDSFFVQVSIILLG